MKFKTIKMPTNRCCDCRRIVSINDWMIKPYSVEMSNKKPTKIICFDCEVKELVCYG